MGKEFLKLKFTHVWVWQPVRNFLVPPGFAWGGWAPILIRTCGVNAVGGNAASDKWRRYSADVPQLAVELICCRCALHGASRFLYCTL